MNVNNNNLGNANWWRDPHGRNPGISAFKNRFPGSNGVAGNSSAVAAAPAMQLRSAAETMLNSLNSMLGRGRNAVSPFGAIRPTSADNGILDIRSFDANRLRHQGTNNVSVEVIQLAQAQINAGVEMNSSALASESGFSVGSHHLAIEVNGRQFDVHINVSATDTVSDVQQRIANAVNSGSSGLQASVVTDDEAGTSMLTIQSPQTGINNEGRPNFTIRDVSGNAVAALDIGEITQEAQNAQFRVHRGFTGALQTSRSNVVDLGFGTMATLNGVGTVRINMGRDETAQQDAFREMVSAFNALREAANGAGRGGTLGNDLDNIVSVFGDTLELIGITFTSDGFMRIDENRLREAAESGALERFVSSDGTSFFNRLTRVAENVSGNPDRFVTQRNDGSNFDFMNSDIQFTPMQMARMAKLTNVGLLFDSWL